MHDVRIEHHADIIAAQQAARRLANELGFPRAACAELMIVASELASNMLKYAGRGLLRVQRVDDDQRGPGLLLTAEDSGPHFKSFETALLDGFNDEGPIELSTFVARRGTASGLGAVQRMTDVLRWEPREAGKAVIAVRYLAGRSVRSIIPGA